MKSKILNGDCMEIMKNMKDNSVDLTLTDIPYGVISRSDNGLRNLDKGKADIVTFDLEEFLEEVTRVTKSTVIIFLSNQQLGVAYDYFDNLPNGTPRQLIWEKTNPMPSNGQYIYLSGIENAIWYRKPKGTFNAHCKNTVFRHPTGSSKLHPTEKNHELLRELILDNSNKGDIVFDPCFGSGSTLLVAKEEQRDILGIEIDKKYHDLAVSRLLN